MERDGGGGRAGGGGTAALDTWIIADRCTWVIRRWSELTGMNGREKLKREEIKIRSMGGGFDWWAAMVGNMQTKDGRETGEQVWQLLCNT